MDGIDNANEDILFAMFQQGDSHAFAVYYKRYFNDLYSYGTNLGVESNQLKDLIQDIFYKVYSDRKRFSSGPHLKFYMLKVLRNAIFDLSRVSGRMVAEENGMKFSLATTVLDNMMDEEYRRSLTQKIDRLLSVLTNRQREAIWLRYMQELEYEEIARMLGMNINGARKLVSRAMGRLKAASTDDSTFALFLALLSAGKIFF
ncbi:sigma-70 family RNA polymerase sigma factor [Alistipes sp. OttesenSCG-928-B03]|nr:sigma-70 family RNA polymerase sigma factor [Alistipes sp. OttesenSCG-928-B03]